MTETEKTKIRNAAFEAIEYVAMANYENRRAAAVTWFDRILDGKDDLTIEQVDTILEEQLEEAGMPFMDLSGTRTV